MSWQDDHKNEVAKRMVKKIKEIGEKKTRGILYWGGWSDEDIEYIISKAKRIMEMEK